MEIVTQEKKWQKVANDMGYNPLNKNVANLLRAHYERILYPLDVFEEQEEKKNQAIKEEIVSVEQHIPWPQGFGKKLSSRLKSKLKA